MGYGLRTANAAQARACTRTPGHRSRVPLWLWAMVLVYVVTYTTLSLVKHNRFHSFTLDLGIMTQVTWNTAHGRLFETSLGRAMDTELVGSYLGNHVRPVFLLLAPVYRVWPDPRVLLILQSLALGLGVVPLYLIAERDLRDRGQRFVLIAVYLLYPALGFTNLFDFHPVALCVPALLLAYWALLERRDTLFWAAIFLTLSTKEEMVVPVAAFGVYCLFKPLWRSKGGWMLILAILWGLLCFVVVIPWFNEGRPYRFLEFWHHLPTAFGLGADVGRLRSDVGMASIDAAYFIVHLLLPLGFLPFLGAGILAVSLPSLAYLLLSSEAGLYRVGHQYAAVLIPWFFLATVQALARLERWRCLRPWAKRWLPLSLLAVGTLGANLKFNPVLVSYRSGYLSRVHHHEEIQNALALIPPEAGVATINPLGPHLANRRLLIGLERYPVPLKRDHLCQADYVLLDLVDCRLVDAPDPRAEYTSMVREILDTGQYTVSYWSGRVLLLQRGISPASDIDEVRAYVEGLEKEGRPCWP